MSSLDSLQAATIIFEPSCHWSRCSGQLILLAPWLPALPCGIFFKYDDIDSPSCWVILSKRNFDFFGFREAIKWPRNLSSNWTKVWILPMGSGVYHVKATSERVVGKNLHNSAGSKVYSSIRFLYAMMCSCGTATGSAGWLDPVSCVLFRSSHLLSTRDWTLSEVLCLLLCKKERASREATLDSPSLESSLLTL